METKDSEVNNRTRTTWVWLTALLAALLLVSSCSSSSSSSSSGEPGRSADPQQALKEAGQTYAENFYQKGGDATKAYSLFTTQCKTVLTKNEFKAASDFTRDSNYTVTDVVATVKGEQGTLDFSLNGKPETGMPWVLENGSWKTSDCTMRQ